MYVVVCDVMFIMLSDSDRFDFRGIRSNAGGSPSSSIEDDFAKAHLQQKTNPHFATIVVFVAPDRWTWALAH